MTRELTTIDQFESIRADLVQRNEFTCQEKLFSESEQWEIADGSIRRHDHAFFSVIGLKGHSLKMVGPLMEQPIIYQPTKAINGFLLNSTNRGLSVLFQARVEPGNTGIMQLAPTVQSTEANYKQVHGGRPTKFINHFLDGEENRILYHGLQSEEGSRYHGKYNLNIIAQADDVDLIDDEADFCLLSAEKIRGFIGLDYVINTDARALLFFLDWDLLCNNSKAFYDRDNPVNRALMESYSYGGSDVGSNVFDVMLAVSYMRAKFALRSEHTSLYELSNWELSDRGLKEKTPQLGFSVFLYEVLATQREVGGWDQPLFSSDTTGRVILFCRINKGVMEFLLSSDREIGYLEGVQLTTSVSIAPGRRPELLSEDELTLLSEADKAEGNDVLLESHQSEEGGRFYNDINHYQIIMTDGDFDLKGAAEFHWLTLSQIKMLGNISSYIAIELRCTLSHLIELS